MKLLCMTEIYEWKLKTLCKTEEEKMKKTNTMESLENGSHALHMGKREVSMADDMVSAEGRVNLTRTNRHQRKRSVSMLSLSSSEQHTYFTGHTLYVLIWTWLVNTLKEQLTHISWPCGLSDVRDTRALTPLFSAVVTRTHAGSCWPWKGLLDTNR
jgi:hypothetical protein